MSGFCPYCDQPRPGFKPEANATAWLLLMILNAIIGICFFPLLVGIPVWFCCWILDAVIQGSKRATCVTCGTQLMSSRPAPVNLQSPSEQDRTPDPEPAPEAGPKERGKLAQWAFPDDKPKLRKRRKRR